MIPVDSLAIPPDQLIKDYSIPNRIVQFLLIQQVWGKQQKPHNKKGEPLTAHSGGGGESNNWSCRCDAAHVGEGL